MRSAREPSEHVRRRVAHNTATNVLTKTLGLAVGFLLTPFILSRVGVASYGLWALTGSVVAYGALLDFGITGGLTKHVAEYWARGEVREAEEVIASALSIYTVFAGVILLAALLLAPFFPRLFHLQPEVHATGMRLVILMGLTTALSLPTALPMATLRALQRFDLANVVSLVAIALSASGTVAVLMLGGGIEALVLVHLAVTAVVQLPALWLLRRIAPDLRFGWRGATRRTARKLIAFSWYIFVSQSATRVQYRTDELIIGAYLPIASVTPYALARRLAEVAQALTDQFMRVLSPLAAELNAVEDTPRLRVVFLHGTRLSLAIHMPIALTTALMAGPLLGAWVGEEYVRYAPLVWLVSAALLIDTGVWPAGALLQAISRHQRLAAFAVFGAASNVALSIVLVRRWGLEGVAAATLITTFVTCHLLIAPYVLTTLGVRAGTMLRSVLWPVLIPVLPSALATIAVRHVVGTASLVMVLAAMALGAAIYWAVFLLTGATMAEKEWVRTTVRSAVAKVRTPSN